MNICRLEFAALLLLGRGQGHLDGPADDGQLVDGDLQHRPDDQPVQGLQVRHLDRTQIPADDEVLQGVPAQNKTYRSNI